MDDIFSRAQTRKTNRIGFALGTAAAILIYALSQAHAAPITCNHLGCSDNPGVRRASKQFSARRHRDANGNRAVIGGRPAGCPHAYCGCGLRKYLGLTDARLNLAWNWARLFPRTRAHPGAAAVRRHHVMLLVEHLAGNRWIVRDYNGGRHLSYIHERDVAGYVFVDPGRSRMAMGE